MYYRSTTTSFHLDLINISGTHISVLFLDRFSLVWIAITSCNWVGNAFEMPAKLCGQWNSSGSVHDRIERQPCVFRLKPDSRSLIRLRLSDMVASDHCYQTDYVLIMTKDSVNGPYCHIPSQRPKRSTVVHDIEKTIVGDEVDIVYFTALSGHKFRFKFNLEWEMFPGIPQPEEEVTCEVGQFIQSYNPHDDEHTEIWNLIRMLTGSLLNFGLSIDNYLDVCKADAKDIECYDYASNNIESIVKRIGKEIDKVTARCENGFGWQWTQAYSQLQQLVDAESVSYGTDLLPIYNTSPTTIPAPLITTILDTLGTTTGPVRTPMSTSTRRTTSTTTPTSTTTTTSPTTISTTTTSTSTTSSTTTSTTTTSTTTTSTTTTFTTTFTTTSTTSTTTTTTEYLTTEETTEIVATTSVETTTVTAVMVNVQYITTTPRYCPSEWSNKSLRKREECDLKYLSVCTFNLFDRTLASRCRKRDLILQYRKIVGEFSRLAIVGDGDRHCIYRINMAKCEAVSFYGIRDTNEFIDKFQKLADTIFDACGKETLRQKWQPQITRLSDLADDKCADRMLNVTELSSNPNENIERDDRENESMCSVSSYFYRTLPIFNSRIFDATNSTEASQQFETIAKAISTLTSCYLDKNKAPCDLLRFPRNEHGCSLSLRLKTLFSHISPFCTSEWNDQFAPRVTKLITAALPITGTCNPSQQMESHALRRWNRMRPPQLEGTFHEKIKRYRGLFRQRVMYHESDIESHTTPEGQAMLYDANTDFAQSVEYEEFELPSDTQCEIPNYHRYLELYDIADEKFMELLNASLAQTSYRAPLQFNFSNRLAMRFTSVLKFILNPAGYAQCGQLSVSCIHYNALFGRDTQISTLNQLIQHASRLVEELNDKCQRTSFTKFYLTLNGKIPF